MQFNVIFIVIALLASASLAMSATITLFAGADCTGTDGGSFSVPSEECFILGSSSTKSINYSGVPNEIDFYVSGSTHNPCLGGAHIFGGGSGCATAPAGDNWKGVVVF